MRHRESGTPSGANTRVLAWIGCGLAILSFSLSVLTFIRGEIRTRADEQQRYVSDTYATHLETDRLLLEHPEVAHLLVVPDEYSDEVARVRAAFASATPEEKARFRLKEEATAFYVYSSFARLVQAQQVPESTRTEATKQFIAAELAYFSGEILRNPRLVYFWRDEKGYRYFDQATQRAYGAFVGGAIEKLQSDPDGPFR